MIKSFEEFVKTTNESLNGFKGKYKTFDDVEYEILGNAGDSYMLDDLDDSDYIKTKLDAEYGDFDEVKVMKISKDAGEWADEDVYVIYGDKAHGYNYEVFSDDEFDREFA